MLEIADSKPTSTHLESDPELDLQDVSFDGLSDAGTRALEKRRMCHVIHV